MRKALIQIAALVLVLPLAWAQAPAKKGAGKNPVVALETSMGTIKVEVFADKAPITAKNFLDYVTSGFYDGTIVNRVDFVVQGGGYLPDMTAKQTRPPIRNESKNGLKNVKGTLAMARYADPNSATSQWFINIQDNTHLDPSPSDPGYAVFAKVVEGMDVVEKIAAVKTGTRSVRGTPFSNVPVQTILVKSAKVLP